MSELSTAASRRNGQDASSSEAKGCVGGIQKSKDKFKDSLPDTIKQLPRHKFATGCCYYLGVFIAFTVLLAMSVKSNLAVRYISLEADPGKCEEVKTTVANNFGLDANGYWSTSTKYNVLNAVLQVKLLDFKSSLEVYTNTYAPKLVKALQLANNQYKTQTMSTNLLSFLTKSFKVQKNSEDETFKFRVNAQADYIFQQESQYGYLLYVPGTKTSRRRLQAVTEGEAPVMQEEEDKEEKPMTQNERDQYFFELQELAAYHDQMARASLKQQLKEAGPRHKLKNRAGHLARAMRGGAANSGPRPQVAPIVDSINNKIKPATQDNEENKRQLNQAEEKPAPKTVEEATTAPEEDLKAEDEDSRRLVGSPTPAPTPMPTPAPTPLPTPAPTPFPTPSSSSSTYAPTYWNYYNGWYYDDPSYSSGGNYGGYYSDDGTALAPGQVATSSSSNYVKSSCTDKRVSEKRYNYTTVTPTLTDYLLDVNIANINVEDFSNFLSSQASSSETGFGSDSSSTATSVDLFVDIRSFTLAAAVNQKVISLDDISYIKPVFKGSPLAYYFLDQPNFVGMKSIICNTTSKICNVPVGNGAMYPIFKHDQELTWYNDTAPNQCTCSLAKQNSDCQNFHLQLLFMYYTGGCFINRQIETKILNTTLDHSLNFLQVYMWGSSQVINNYYYEVMEPNCKGKFTLRYAPKNLDNFAKLPPTSLIQDYYKCRYGTSDIITNSFSNAFANSSAVSAAWLPLLVALMVWIIRKRYGIVVETVSEDQIQEVLHEMAMEKISREKEQKRRALSGEAVVIAPTAPNDQTLEMSVASSRMDTTTTAFV